MRRSDSISSVNSYFFKSTSTSSDNQKLNNTFDFSALKFGISQPNQSNLDQIFLRLCFDCGVSLEKKYKVLKDKIVRSTFSNLYGVIMELFCYFSHFFVYFYFIKTNFSVQY